MSHNGFSEEDKALIRQIAREMLPEFKMSLMNEIELQVWRTAGKLVMMTGVVSAMAAAVVTKGIEYTLKGTGPK